MRSEVRFVMHPDDEGRAVQEILSEPAVVLVDGPRWKAASPTTSRSLASIGGYCIVWSTDDAPELEARFIPECNDWYCKSEQLTIQFLRSSIEGIIITEGRFAVQTDGAPHAAAAGLERRFKRLRNLIKKTYTNSLVRWRNPDVPEAPAGPGRSANPSKPDRSLWIGPAALAWLRADRLRRVKQFSTGGAEGILAEPPNPPLQLTASWGYAPGARS